MKQSKKTGPRNKGPQRRSHSMWLEPRLVKEFTFRVKQERGRVCEVLAGARV
jgi:hypothetical protein